MELQNTSLNFPNACLTSIQTLYRLYQVLTTSPITTAKFHACCHYCDKVIYKAGSLVQNIKILTTSLRNESHIFKSSRYGTPFLFSKIAKLTCTQHSVNVFYLFQNCTIFYLGTVDSIGLSVWWYVSPQFKKKYVAFTCHRTYYLFFIKIQRALM